MLTTDMELGVWQRGYGVAGVDLGMEMADMIHDTGMTGNGDEWRPG